MSRVVPQPVNIESIVTATLMVCTFIAAMFVLQLAIPPLRRKGVPLRDGVQLDYALTGLATFLLATVAVLAGSMLLMAKKWSFNGSVAAWLESHYPRDHPRAHLYALSLMAGLVIAGALAGRDLLSRSLMAATAWIICTPALFPWYLIMLAPLLAMRRDPALIALLSIAPLVELVNITYQKTGVWHPVVWASVLQYSAFYGLLLVSAVAGWGMFQRSATTGGLKGH